VLDAVAFIDGDVTVVALTFVAGANVELLMTAGPVVDAPLTVAVEF
jgi:hypothetical protein